MILNLVDLLMDMGVLKQFLRDEALSVHCGTPTSDRSKQPPKSETNLPTSPTADSESKIKKHATPHRIMMNVIVKVLKHLGCPHGCAGGQRGPAAEFLRTQSQNVLVKLNRASNKQFSRFLRDYVRYQPINDVLDFFHAYVGFCVDPSSLLSPLSKFLSVSSPVRETCYKVFERFTIFTQIMTPW